MKFEQINKAFNQVFVPGQMSIGMVVPIESYPKHPVPSMKNHLERVKLVEQLGFKALWVRDVPFHVPTFGDAGQMFDPFTYLGFLAAHTSEIALCTGSIALPLHHPVHVAKSAATIDQLSGGRLILGVASGDRYEEYPGMGLDYNKRGEVFRDAFQYIRQAQESFPTFQTTHFGGLDGKSDILPKATQYKLPILLTGNSRQSIEWIAEHADGWMYYPRNLYMQEYNIKQFREAIPSDQGIDKPFMQPIHIDLHPDDDFKPQPIHLGFRIGMHYLKEYLQHLHSLGVNHLGFNLRFNTSSIENTLERIAKEVFPLFHTKKETETI